MSKPGRNDPCPCGSGKKYKRCCIDKKPRERSVMIGSCMGEVTVSILNELVKHCDKEASIVLEAISESGYYQDGEVRYSIDQIPVALL